MLAVPPAPRHRQAARPICGMLAGPKTPPLSPHGRIEISRPHRDLLSTICIVHCLAMPFVVALCRSRRSRSERRPFPRADALARRADERDRLLPRLSRAPQRRRRGGAVAVAVLALVALWGHDHWDPTFEVTVNVAASICSRSRTGGTSARSALHRHLRRLAAIAGGAEPPGSSASSCVNSSRCAVRWDAQTSCVPCATVAASARFSAADASSSRPSHGSSSSSSRGLFTSARAISARRAWP